MVTTKPKNSVGIVFASRFLTASNSKKFGGYIKYMTRDEAVRTHEYNQYNFVRSKDFGNYNNYMGNPEKSSGLFSAREGSFLSQVEIKNLQEKFLQAQKNNSCMWQDIISFDNNFLEKYGLYNSKTKELNEERVMSATRIAMKNILEKEGMSSSGVWTGAIHYNTKHIHVHIALVEPIPTKPYFIDKKTNQVTSDRVGYRKKRNIKNFKSDFANHLLDHSLELEKISTFVREELSNKNTKEIFSQKKNELLWRKIYHNLPQTENGYRSWKYNMNTINEVRPDIDKFIDQYLNNDKSQQFAELKKMLSEEDEFRNEVYGGSLSEDFENNIEDFSKNNQKEILKIVPEATVVHRVEVWKAMGFELKDNQTEITIWTPKLDKNREVVLNGKGLPEFETKIAYDISQLKNKGSVIENSHYKELRTRLGNALLRSMIDYDKDIKQAQKTVVSNSKNWKGKYINNGLRDFGKRLQYEQEKQSRKNLREYNMLNHIEDELKGWNNSL